MTVLALAVAVLLIRDPRQASLVGRRHRRTVLLPGMASAGMTMRADIGDSHLAARPGEGGHEDGGHPLQGISRGHRHADTEQHTRSSIIAQDSAVNSGCWPGGAGPP
jgi:hypothetical protein